jgi:hypothetical protein
MPSAAQVKANQANAEKSTGPTSAEGKAKASRNATTHGLATGFLHVAEADREAFHQFEANLTEAVRPQGALELETCNQLVHAGWRLQRIRTLLYNLYAEHQADPFITPAASAQLRQLGRYRATLEMTFYRAIKQLRDLQTRRAGRDIQLHPPEKDFYPLHLNPGLYTAARYGRGDRELILCDLGLMGPWTTSRIVLDENYLPKEKFEKLERPCYAPPPGEFG